MGKLCAWTIIIILIGLGLWNGLTMEPVTAHGPSAFGLNQGAGYPVRGSA